MESNPLGKFDSDTIDVCSDIIKSTRTSSPKNSSKKLSTNNDARKNQLSYIDLFTKKRKNQ